MSAFAETPYWWSGLAAGARAVRPVAPRADVVVIGSGYTGLSAARTLAKGGAAVVVLEKESIGWGASSRNGGQVLTGMKLGADQLLKHFGRERARALYQSSLDAIDFVERVVAEEGIECGFRRSGHLEAACKPAHFERFERDQRLLEREFAHRVRLLPKRDQRSELDSDYYHGLLVDERSAAVQPAQYVQGLASAAERAGAELHEATPALRCTKTAGGFRVATPRGTIDATDVLVATNGYTGALTPKLRRRVIPIGSYIVATEPLGAERAAALLPTSRVVFDSKNFLFYFRLSDDHRLLFGGRAQFTPSNPQSTRSAAAILRRGLAQVFPDLEGVRLEYAWSGNVAFTRDLTPHAGRMDGLAYAMGYCAHGVGLASLLGDAMAETLLGRPDRNPFRGLPFPVVPLYDGRPWFLPFVGLWYKLQDWIH